MSVDLNSVTGNWVKLSVDGVQFVMPQQDIVKTGYLQTQLTQHQTLKGILFPVSKIISAPNTRNDMAGHTDMTESIPSAEKTSANMPELKEDEHYIALSSRLELMDYCPKQRFILTTFVGSEWQWCWDDVNVLLDVQLDIEPLPMRLSTSYTPILGLVMMDDAPVFYTTAERIFKYVLWQMER